MKSMVEKNCSLTPNFPSQQNIVPRLLLTWSLVTSVSAPGALAAPEQSLMLSLNLTETLKLLRENMPVGKMFWSPGLYCHCTKYKVCKPDAVTTLKTRIISISPTSHHAHTRPRIRQLAILNPDFFSQRHTETIDK